MSGLPCLLLTALRERACFARSVHTPKMTYSQLRVLVEKRFRATAANGTMQKFMDELQAKAENDEEICERCSCGRDFFAPTALKPQRKIARREAAHYEATELKMKKAKLSKGNVLFVIQSHHEQNHHCSSLLEQLSNSGVPEDYVHVRYGEHKDKITYKGLPITRGVAFIRSLIDGFPKFMICSQSSQTSEEYVTWSPTLI